jgi:hypothetical protein
LCTWQTKIKYIVEGDSRSWKRKVKSSNENLYITHKKNVIGSRHYWIQCISKLQGKGKRVFCRYLDRILLSLWRYLNDILLLVHDSIPYLCKNSLGSITILHFYSSNPNLIIWDLKEFIVGLHFRKNFDDKIIIIYSSMLKLFLLNVCTYYKNVVKSWQYLSRFHIHISFCS